MFTKPLQTLLAGGLLLLSAPLLAQTASSSQSHSSSAHQEEVVIQSPGAGATITPVPGAAVTISAPGINPGPQAASNSMEAQFKSETVRTHLDQARTSYNSGDRAAASRHLNEAVEQLRGLKLTGDMGERSQLNQAISQLERLELNIRTGGGAQAGQFQSAFADTYNALARYNFYKAQGYSNPHTVLMDGSVLRPDGSVVRPDGTVLQPVRVTVTPQNTYLRVDTNQAIAPSSLQANQVLMTQEGNIVMPNGTVVRRQESSHSESSTIRRGSGAPPTTSLTGTGATNDGSRFEASSTSQSHQSTSIGGQNISHSSSAASQREVRHYTNEALANYEAYARESQQTLTPEVQNRLNTLRSWSASSSTTSSTSTSGAGLPPDFEQFGTTINALPPVTRTQTSASTESTVRETIR